MILNHTTRTNNAATPNDTTILKLSVVFACLLSANLNAQTLPDCTVSLPPKQNVICLKQAHDNLVRDYPESIKRSRDLVKEGDRYFQKKNYLKAYKAYDLAYANLPNAYSYLRTGDVVFLWLATEKEFRDDNAKSTGSCLLPKKFAQIVDHVVHTQYETGIELAKILKAGPPVSPAMLADVERKSRCLTALADQYRHKTEGCVDVMKIRACMGLPQKP